MHAGVAPLAFLHISALIHVEGVVESCCAVGARAVGTRRGDGPSRGLASKADGWGRLAARDGAGPEGGWGNKWWVRWRGASASSEVPLRR